MRRNFADASYEPTDEDLTELVTRAFAGVAAQNDHLLLKIREEISTSQERIIRKLEESLAKK